MDLQMPEMNGFDATEYIRKELKLNIPIIALTADVTTADLAKCKAVGMNDYISKPVDERLLHSKIILSLARVSAVGEKQVNGRKLSRLKVTDLKYLTQRTKSDPLLMSEMISLFLGQTTPLVKEMKDSLRNQDWQMLYSIVHKIIPSLSIIGMDASFIEMTKTLQDNARNAQNINEIIKSAGMLDQLLMDACDELQTELNAINNPKP
jgi:CheY-like chemotaxis protein